MRETGGLELASTITLVLQANRLIKCASHPKTFVMIVYEFSLPVKQARIDTYYFRLMLVLVIPQIETLVVFVFGLRLHIVSDVTRIICK